MDDVGGLAVVSVYEDTAGSQTREFLEGLLKMLKGLEEFKVVVIYVQYDCKVRSEFKERCS